MTMENVQKQILTNHPHEPLDEIFVLSDRYVLLSQAFVSLPSFPLCSYLSALSHSLYFTFSTKYRNVKRIEDKIYLNNTTLYYNYTLSTVRTRVRHC
jgi:hypothetical protein